jgi:hypothetical protein
MSTSPVNTSVVVAPSPDEGGCDDPVGSGVAAGSDSLGSDDGVVGSGEAVVGKAVVGGGVGDVDVAAGD